MDTYALTDFEWRVIQTLLPNKPRGVPRVVNRRPMSVSEDAGLPPRDGRL